jgi:hypothetical protein
MFRISVLIPAILTLASCTPTRETFEQRNAEIRSNPELKAKTIRDCIAHKYNDQTIKELSYIAKVPANEVQPIVCRRATEAMLSGKITYEDITSFYNYHRVTPSMLNALRGA